MRMVTELRSVSQVAPLVSVLLRSSGPSAIPRLIVSIRVDSVDGVASRRTLFHVSEEDGKVLPSVADGDASPAVVAPTIRLRVRTSHPHRRPRHVSGAVDATTSVSMPCLVQVPTSRFPLKTSAGPCSAPASLQSEEKTARSNNMSVPAVTYTEPLGSYTRNPFDNLVGHESSKPLTRHNTYAHVNPHGRIGGAACL